MCASEPSIPRFIGQRHIDGAILFEGGYREAIPDSEPRKHIAPFELRFADALPLYIFRTPTRQNEVIEGKEQRPVWVRAESNRVIDTVDRAGKDSTEPPVVLVPIPPHIQGVERKNFPLTRTIGNLVKAKVCRSHTPSIARGNMDLLSKQGGVKFLAGFSGLFTLRKCTHWEEADHEE